MKEARSTSSASFHIFKKNAYQTTTKHSGTRPTLPWYRHPPLSQSCCASTLPTLLDVFSHAATIFILRGCPQVQHIVATNQHLAKISREVAIDVFFSRGQLQVHVRVDCDE